MLVVVASYRQNVHAYPSGGGDYEVASTNLGPRVGLAVASALMVDYTLTVAVSVSAGRGEPGLGVPGAGLARHAHRGARGGGDRADEPARGAGVGHRVRDPHLLLHRRGRADDHLGRHPARARPPPARGERRLPDHGQPASSPACCPGLPAAARVLLRLHRAHRGRGDQQRGARVPQAEEQERRDHAGPARRHRGVDVRRGHRAGAGQPRALRARAGPDRAAARRPPSAP